MCIRDRVAYSAGPGGWRVGEADKVPGIAKKKGGLNLTDFEEVRRRSSALDQTLNAGQVRSAVVRSNKAA
ncbi:MAG: hypothetical protein N3G20_05410, partial [Verrucomicrobiae bacterium]|nr:hypothetical protein [Verrucomicrobiae bacterium]